MVTSTAHSLARDELVRALTVYSGVTTSDGSEDKDTLIDSSLIGENDFITGKTILLMSGEAEREDKGAASFDTLTGRITLESEVSAQIVAGTLFRVLNISSVETLIKNLTNGLISFSGTTTAEGGALGSSLICSDLEDEADFDGNQVVITTGAYRGQARDIVAATDGGTVTPHLNFGGVIVEGTEFIITAMRVVPAEVAALAADLGDMADAATNDNMSDITTTSALAKLRLILNRLSPDAFSAIIHAGARTSLDTMLAEMAKYFVADGGGFDLKINNGVNRDNLNLIMRDFFTVIGILNTSIWQPTIGGSTQVTVVAAIQALANYWAPLGAGLDIKINNGVNRDDLKNILKDYFAVFGISDTSVWNPVINAVARDTVEAAIEALAGYWAPIGEGLDIKINNGVNRDDLKNILKDYFAVFGISDTSVWNPVINAVARDTVEAAIEALAGYWAPIGEGLDIKINDGTNKNTLKEILKDYFTMIGCLDTSVFNPTIGGTPRTTFDDAWAAMATYFAAGGAAIAATVDPGGTERATLELILEDLGKMLAGGGGITTWPAAADIGNGVSMAEGIRAILTSLVAGDDYDNYTKINNVAIASINAAFQGIAGIFAAAGTNTFGPTVRGTTPTELETALTELSTYFAAAGAAYSVKVNNNTLRTNLEQILQDFFNVIGCDGTNVFDPSIGGSDRLTFDLAFEALDVMLSTITGHVENLDSAIGVFHEQAAVELTFNTVSGSEADVLNLIAASTRYIVRSLRLKFPTPGANTITVRLYELINGSLIEVNDFEVTSANFGTYHSLMDMFGIAQLAGDNLKVTTRVSAGGDLATTGQYSFAKTNV